MARLLLVRHGETEGQSSLRYWGRTDVALDKSGLRQAELLRDRLAGEKIAYICSSPLKRAQETAILIASRHNQAVEVCRDLKEIDFGDLEGLNYTEIQARFPEVARLWSIRSEKLVYPGGESVADLEERVASVAARFGKGNPAGTVLVVAHAGVLRSLICQLLELEPKHRWSIRLDLASLSIVETFPEMNILSLLNDRGHLERERR
jgi:alpha-ribazole phosphatase